MIHPFTFLCLGIFFAVLYFRYQSKPKDAPRSSRKQQLKVAKVLFAAFLAWMAINYSLQHTIAKIDGADYQPTLMERFVSFLSK